MKAVLVLVLIVGISVWASSVVQGARYTPDWPSLNSRPLPAWYDQVKFGIFIHWGVFSVPSYSCNYTAAEWYWYGLKGDPIDPCITEFHNANYGPDFKYADFAARFDGSSLFDPNEWARLFASAGAKYVVLTSKHHEGFANWPSPQAWNWNSKDVGPHQDSVGMLTQAVKAQGLHMGLYHSLFEWFNPLYLADKANGTSTIYVDEILQPQLHDIVKSYSPEVIWSDGDWERYDTYWKSKEFLAWLYNDSPVADTVVVNDRWGIGDTCVNGGFWTCQDRYNPHDLVPHKWENAMTIDSTTWGFARNHNISYYLTIENLINSLVSTVAYGGNLLLNVGPTKEGTIAPIFQERLLQMGSWLGVNGDSIYNTHPWRIQNQTVDGTTGYYTSNAPAIYFTLFEWPSTGIFTLNDPMANGGATSASLLGYGQVSSTALSKGVTIKLPSINPSQLPCEWAWVVQLNGFK